MEDVLQQCKRTAEERKKKILAAYEAASRSGPSGVVKGVDFEPFINADGKSVLSCVSQLTHSLSPTVSEYQPTKMDSGATFQMSGGVSKVTKSQPNTPMSPGFPGGLIFPQPVREDPAQEIIRQRQREAEEQKKRLLAAYDYVSKQGAGEDGHEVVLLDMMLLLSLPRSQVDHHRGAQTSRR